MKKLTAGIFTILLGVVSVGSANAEIASKAYVDNQKTAVEGSITAAVAGKADKATTLVGYGITDAMTTTAVNDALNLKANTADLGDLATKDVIVTAEITDKNVTKAKLADDVQASLGKADSALQTAGLADYAKTADVTTGLATKADKTTVGTMTDLTTTVKGTVVGAINEVKAESTDAVSKATAASTAAAAAQTDVDALDAVVAHETTGLAATKKIADDAAIAAAANITAIGNKADKATTLAGYNIGDAMTATAIGTALDLKANTKALGVLATAAPGECANANSKCVLTFNGTDYAWEVVER